MKLLIISHTDHYTDANGNIVGWGPTVREIDALTALFDEIVHIACLYKGSPPASSVKYNSGKVRFVGISPFGGDDLENKLKIVTTASRNLRLIKEELRNADVFQFRAPTSIGLYIIPYLSWFSRKEGWYKYAGNWMANRPALSYRIQRWMLLNMQSRKITINGRWPDQPAQCLSFENPCLYEEDRVDGKRCVANKHFDGSLNLCFAGRLDKEKGVYDILRAVEDYPYKERIGRLDIVGDGPELEHLKNAVKDTGIDVHLHGALSREDLFAIYKQAHLLLLPSESEGFPKVVAEAANFGCIPVVTDVSSIGQYVNESNGFLWQRDEMSFADYLAQLDLFDPAQLKQMAANAHEMAAAFTYDHYISRIRELILQ